jgi:hypothetical protein
MRFDGGRTPLANPSSDDPTGLADWLEAQLLIHSRNRATRAWIRKQLKNTVFPEEGLGPHDLSVGDNDEADEEATEIGSLEVAIDSLFTEVERRRKVCPTSYPFIIDADREGISVDARTNGLVYVFLLLISVSLSLRAQKRHREVDEIFDLIALEALKTYLGPNSRGLRFGSPRSGQRPTTFAAAVRWLSGVLALPSGPGKPRRHTGDGGVDLIAWLPFRDEREAFLVVLAQCTVQMSWQRKAEDIVLRKWHAWVDFGGDPATCLAVPFAVPANYDQWDEVRRSAVLVFDRLRLAHFAARAPNEISTPVSAWTARELKSLGARSTRLILDWTKRRSVTAGRGAAVSGRALRHRSRRRPGRG